MKQHLKIFLQACITINDQEFEQIAQAFKPRSIKRNHILLPSGSVCNGFYYIVKGGLRVFYVTQKGHEKTSPATRNLPPKQARRTSIKSSSSFFFLQSVIAEK